MLNNLSRLIKKLIGGNKNRKGIVVGCAIGTDALNAEKEYQFVWEIEELSRANNLSKIRVTGFSRTMSDSLPEWIHTSNIEFFKDNNNG